MEHFYQSIPGYNHNKIFYEQIISELQDGAHIVEIGCWKGCSAAFVAVEIINSGKNIKFDCVDIWLDNWSEPNEKIRHGYKNVGTPYEQFLENMKPVENHYTPIRMASVKAAALYQDNSLDLVFIDADHEYKSVREDILAWLPKVKSGGVIAGDDYDNTFPGVIKATNELLKPLKINGITWIYKNE